MLGLPTASQNFMASQCLALLTVLAGLRPIRRLQPQQRGPTDAQQIHPRWYPFKIIVIVAARGCSATTAIVVTVLVQLRRLSRLRKLVGNPKQVAAWSCEAS